MKKIISLLMAAALSFGSMSAVIKVHTIGDSTMSEYDESNVKRGWGMFLQAFFDPTYVIVNNAGHSGRDSRTFYSEPGDWDAVSAIMQSGDYLIIQFGHNDEGNDNNLRGLDNLEYKAYCQDNELPVPSEKRGTNPQTTFRDYLRLYISEARAKGVTPILASPICRNNWSNGNISRWGQHDLGDKFAKIEDGQLLTNQSLPANDLSMSYVEAMRIVSQEEDVPFIDMMEATRLLMLQYGQAACGSQLFTTGDGTHLNALAATLVAREAAQLLKNAGILSQYINIPTTIGANPTSVAIGETYSGVAQNKEVLLTGSGLEPVDGTINATASTNLLLSLDKASYAPSVTCTYTGGNLFQKLYIRALYSEAGEQEDSVVVVSGDVRVVIPVTASVISLDGGSTVSALWTMLDRPAADAVIEGPVSAELSLSHMMAPDSKADFTDVDNTQNVSLVRYSNADDNGSKADWPAGEIDENAGRYIDFSMTAPSTMEVRITKISMDLASHSTATMCCRVRAGIGAGITNGQELVELKNMPNKTIVHYEWTPTITIPAGETLHVRVLPWHESSSVGKGKYICPRNVMIEGQAFTATHIENTEHQIQRATKVLRNGQLMIKKGNVLYNATGTIVK